MVMGCYGIGITRTVAASIEQNHDKDGIIWPVAIAPYEVVIVPANNKDEGVMNAARHCMMKWKTVGMKSYWMTEMKGRVLSLKMRI